jgi:HEPN domain-containing protein
MVNINTQIQYWLKGGQEDWLAACSLIEHGHHRQGLFMAHLALEKFLKAKVCQETRDLAPRLHNLVQLAALAKLDPTQEQQDTLADMNQFNLQGRYPEEMASPPTAEKSRAFMARTKEAIEWLTQQS